MTNLDLLGDPLPEPLPSGERLRYWNDLVGHTIIAAFEDFRKDRNDIDILLVTETKCWIAGAATHDGFEDAPYLEVVTRGDSLHDFVTAQRLLDANCINPSEFAELQKAEDTQDAARNEQIANRLRRELARLEGKTS